jgi:HlyD family secretion protein
MNLKLFIRTNRIASLGILLAMGLSGYVLFHGSNASAQTRYVLATVEKGTISTTISGSGQVAASQQIDVKAKTSGDVVSVVATAGQKVKTGSVLAYVDSADAQRSVRDAQVSLQSAQLALQKLTQDQQSNVDTTNDTLNQSYRDAVTALSNAFLKLPSIVDTAHGVLYDNTLQGGCSPNSCQYGNLVSDTVHNDLLAAVARAKDDYTAARTAYDTTFASYRTMRTDASEEEIVAVLDSTEHAATLLAQVVKSEKNLLDLVVDDMTNQASKNNVTAKIPSQLTTYQNDIGTAIGTLNSTVSSLTNADNSIASAKRSLQNDQLGNPIDLATQENIVAQRTAALQDARTALANCAVRAPFSGVVAAISIKKGDTLSQGGTVATVISDQRIATIALNEVDVAKVKAGEKVTLTFDAITDLTIAGTVADVDAIGTVSQGVVTYDVTISFDTQNDRIKPGMSVASEIMTETKTDALLVPNGAVKTSSGTSYVQTIDANVAAQAQTQANITGAAGITLTTTPTRTTVEIGLSNDTYTEITSGLKEGDAVIAKTIAAASTATTSTASTTRSILSTGGGPGGMGR